MATMDRRAFLGRSAAFAGAGLFSSGGARDADEPDARSPAASATRPRVRAAVPDRRPRTGRMMLALPRGFSYTTFGVIGATMSDGNITPLALDGMAAFPHPDRPEPGAADPQPRGPQRDQQPVEPRDRRRGAVHLRPDGGRRLLDARLRPAHPHAWCATSSRSRARSSTAPAATGSTTSRWLTGEETVSVRSGRRHGYVFPVPVTREPGEMPSGPPIIPMGRFSHEAVTTDQRTGIVYETEDAGAGVGSGFYRYLPTDPEDLYAGGRAADARRRRAPAGRPAPGPADRPRAAGRVVHDQHAGHELDQQQPGRQRLPPGLRPGRRQVQPARRDLVGRRGLDLLRVDQRRRRQERRQQRRRLPAGLRPDLALPRRWRRRGADPRLRVRRHRGTRLARQHLRLAARRTDPVRGRRIQRLRHPPERARTSAATSTGWSASRATAACSTSRSTSSTAASWPGATFSPDGQTLFFNMLGSGTGSVRPYTGIEGMTFALTGPWENGPL